MTCHGHLIARREAVVRRGPPIAPITCPSRLQLGYSEIEVAELLGLSRETVSRWWTATLIIAWSSRGGTTQAARSATIVTYQTTGKQHSCGRSSSEKSPAEVGIASPLWTRRAVAELIQQRILQDLSMPVPDRQRACLGGGEGVPRCRTVMPRIGTPRRSAIALEVAWAAIDKGRP